MTTQNKSKIEAGSPVSELQINNPDQILQLMHPKKQLILRHLFSEALTIQNIKELTQLNPGTIKRLLDQLIASDLVYVQFSKRNEYNILMKFYRAKAKKFHITMVLPDDLA